MYSSNQILKVSCDERQLKPTIDFIFNMFGIDTWQRKNFAYQKLSDGRIAIGWYGNEPENGWCAFCVDNPSTEMIAVVVRDYLKAYPPKERHGGDGSCRDGYILESIETWTYEEADAIQAPFYTIFVASAYSNYYSK